MKVVLLDSQVISGYDYSIEKKIIEEAGHQFVMEKCQNEDDVVAKCSDADAILNIAVKMTKKSIEKLSRCQVMVRYGIGVDEFDVDAATEMGIKICNVSTYCISEVALHTTSLVLALSRQLKHFDKCVESGLWNKNLGMKMHRPNSQIVGLIGFGNIARMVAKNLSALGYSIVAYDPFVSDDLFNSNNVKKVSLDELYALANIISLHLPQTDKTYQMINKTSIAKMKDNVILVNASRGGLVNEEDLLESLNAGKIAACALDVMASEPMLDTDNALLKMNNVIITPHIAYNSVEASQELFSSVATTVIDIFNGKIPENVLNKKGLGLS